MSYTFATQNIFSFVSFKLTAFLREIALINLKVNNLTCKKKGMYSVISLLKRY